MVRYHKEQMKGPVLSRAQVRERQTNQPAISTTRKGPRGVSSGVK